MGGGDIERERERVSEGRRQGETDSYHDIRLKILQEQLQEARHVKEVEGIKILGRRMSDTAIIKGECTMSVCERVKRERVSAGTCICIHVCHIIFLATIFFVHVQVRLSCWKSLYPMLKRE